MPRLIRYPEQVMIELSADLLYVRFKVNFDLLSSDFIPDGFDDLKRWFNENLGPKTWELIGPSAFSGVVEEFIGHRYAIYPMSTIEIHKFSDRWENNSSGTSIDERWQAYLMSYDPEMEEKLARLNS